MLSSRSFLLPSFRGCLQLHPKTTPHLVKTFSSTTPLRWSWEGDSATLTTTTQPFTATLSQPSAHPLFSSPTSTSTLISSTTTTITTTLTTTKPKPLLSRNHLLVATFATSSSSTTASTTTTTSSQSSSRWEAFRTRFRERKEALLLEYGVSLIVVHELLGISSYLLGFSIYYFGWVDPVWVIESLGISSTELAKRGIEVSSLDPTKSPALAFGMGVATVKTLDLLGLVPLRWCLTILLTPLVARLVGPQLDRFAQRVKRLFGRRKKD